MKLLIGIIVITWFYTSVNAANSKSFNAHDFYKLEVPNDELALKSIARIVMGAKKEKGEYYEESITNKINKFKDNLHKISNKTYTPISIDFDKTSNALSDQIISRYNELQKASNKDARLNNDKLRQLKWKIRYILLVNYLHSITESYYNLKQSSHYIKSCDEIDSDGVHVCINSINNRVIEYDHIVRKGQMEYQTRYTVSRINDEWVLTSILIDPDILTSDYFIGLAYLK